MADLKRDCIKYVRDLAKSAYVKENECRICGSTTDLQFHHMNTLTLLWERWTKNNKVIINNVEDINYHREQFKGEHYKEIYTDTVTLCKDCHMNKLHKVYGKTPSLATAEKQKRWIEKQRIKYQNKIKSEKV